MNLKEQTFAVLAEKPNSIAHNWFQQAFSQAIEWVPGNWYVFDPTLGRPMFCSSDDDCTLFPYPQRFDEAHFEKRLKAEQENELEPIIGNSRSTGENAQTFPKKTVFGKENIAHKHPSFEPKGDGNVTLDKNEPLAANKKEISQDDIKRAQYYLECFTKKIMPNYESTGDYSDLNDKGKIEMLVNDVYNVMLKNKDVESKWGDYFQKLIEKMDINKMSAFKYNDAADALSYSMREIVKKFKVSEIKFPKSVFHPNGFTKPFKGVTITKSEAEKILRDKFKLPDYVEFKIVE